MINNFKHSYAYYKGILVLPDYFDEALLKKAYRREAMKWHPDKNPGDAYAEERLKLVNEAYEFFNEVKKINMQKNNNNYTRQPSQKREPSQREIEFIVWSGIAFIFYIYYKIVVG